MSEKTYTPVEVSIKVLDKVKELAKNASCEVEKGCIAKADEKKVYSGAVGDVDPKIITDMKTTLAADKAKKQAKPNKLEEFIANKKAKKTAQMEKALGMNGPAKPAGSPGALPLATPVAAKPPKAAIPAIGTPNKKV